MKEQKEHLTNEDIKVMFSEDTGELVSIPMSNRKYIEWLENKLKQLLTKEKEQREELIKKVAEEAYYQGALLESIQTYFRLKRRDRAKKYANEIVKNKL